VGSRQLAANSHLGSGEPEALCAGKLSGFRSYRAPPTPQFALSINLFGEGRPASCARTRLQHAHWCETGFGVPVIGVGKAKTGPVHNLGFIASGSGKHEVVVPGLAIRD